MPSIEHHHQVIPAFQKVRRSAAALLAVVGAATALLGAPPVERHASVTDATSTRTSREALGTPYELMQHVAPGPTQWLACRAIGYRIDPSGMPAGLDDTIERTMASIARQTGVQFRYDGSDRRSFDSTSFSRDVPTIYFSFTRGDADGIHFSWPGTVGVGGPASAWTQSFFSHFEAITYGRVLLYSGFHARRLGAGQTWQSLITHEVGHALNLAHRRSITDAMYPDLIDSAPGRFSRSEVTALRSVLRTQGCDYGAFANL